MDSLLEREEAFENKFKHDQELLFKIRARRNKLLGLWVADILGLSGATADTYARQIIAADMEEPGDDDVFRRIESDLKAKDKEVSRHRLEKEMIRCLEEAQKQVMTEKG